MHPPLLRLLGCGLLLTGLGLSTGGCALGDGGVNPRGDGSIRADGGPEGMDGGEPVGCTPPCPTGQVCRDSICVSATLDVDGDGVPASMDCDDDDPAVGATASRACSSSCGDGIEMCTDGVWAACNAPATCDCVASAPPRQVDCGMCGTQRQVCVEGMWQNDGGCTGEGVCMPGQTESGSSCGGGCGTERRTCQTDCSWGAYECIGGGECMAGQTEMESRACGNCNSGTQSRTRTCSSSCSWGAWSGYTTCAGESGCTPGQTRTGCDVNSAGSPTPCGVEVCSSSCTWGGCQLASGAQCMSGSGSNFQCCTPSGGGSGWQFCDASSCQWFPCASHSC